MVAVVVEGLVFVDATAPYAQHVHIRVFGLLQKLGVAVVTLAAGERSRVRGGGDPVGAAHEERLAVDDELERLADVVALLDELHRAQPVRVHEAVVFLVVLQGEVIEVGISCPVRPPQLRILDSHGNHHLVRPFVQLRLVLDLLAVAVLVGDIQMYISGDLFVGLDLYLHFGYPRTGGIAGRFRVFHVKVVDF